MKWKMGDKVQHKNSGEWGVVVTPSGPGNTNSAQVRWNTGDTAWVPVDLLVARTSTPAERRDLSRTSAGLRLGKVMPMQGDAIALAADDGAAQKQIDMLYRVRNDIHTARSSGYDQGSHLWREVIQALNELISFLESES